MEEQKPKQQQQPEYSISRTKIIKYKKTTTTTSKASECNVKRAEASFRISSFILKKAWMKRCHLIDDLNAKVAQSSVLCQRAEERLEAKKSLYFVKHHENENLTCELRLTEKDVEELLITIDELNLYVETLEARKSELLQQFGARCDECIDINMQISDLKMQLMGVLETNERLERQIKTEKERAQKVIREGDQLNEELNRMKEHCVEKENRLLARIDEFEEEILRTKAEKKELKRQLNEIKRYTEEYERCKPSLSGPTMEMEKALLYEQAAVLREAYENTIENKCRKYCKAAVSAFVEVCKILLPAFPNDTKLFE